MAPTPTFHLLSRSNYHSHYGHSNGFSGGAIGGVTIAAILFLMACIFIYVAYSEYKKAKRLQQTRNIPISTGRIFGKALLYSVTIGVAACICAECCDGTGDATTQDPSQSQMDQGGGFVPVNQSMQMPNYTPQMDYTPVQSAAQDGIQ